MLLVVDVNVIISAILNKGHSLQVFLLNALKGNFEFIAPEFLLIEIGKHTARISQKTRFSHEEAVRILGFITRQVHLISQLHFDAFEKQAKMMLAEHEKDIPYLALALAKNCTIFSGDKTLKQLCPERVKTPRELLEELLDS